MEINNECYNEVEKMFNESIRCMREQKEIVLNLIVENVELRKENKALRKDVQLGKDNITILEHEKQCLEVELEIKEKHIDELIKRSANLAEKLKESKRLEEQYNTATDTMSEVYRILKSYVGETFNKSVCKRVAKMEDIKDVADFVGRRMRLSVELYKRYRDAYTELKTYMEHVCSVKGKTTETEEDQKPKCFGVGHCHICNIICEYSDECENEVVESCRKGAPKCFGEHDDEDFDCCLYCGIKEECEKHSERNNG